MKTENGEQGELQWGDIWGSLHGIVFTLRVLACVVLAYHLINWVRS